ncbi:hypothetical protein [Asanoa iriomotensis]|uniref:Gram-positive cocci surface proteins LPxTG domain-containing protein n=1 Tax=Asanoa iriomotensis TaxID=234613 RepID=A0ABQ4C816_9ACTN|nr:hypothetical protein [Asanoa iriomotensis]GIF58922.1 hypothetical protein Air01nite_50170 [Asanoa iriomotensis]
MSVVSFAALNRIVLAGAAVAAGAALIAGAPAYAEPAPGGPPAGDQSGPAAEPGRAEGTWIEVSPSTVQAGEQVEIKASCKERVDEAKAHSKAFGEIVLVPQRGFLVGDATVPRDTRAGEYEVKLTCVKSGKAETTLRVIENSRPSHGPHTGGGGLADNGGDGTMALAGGLASVVAGAGLAVALRRRRRLA